MIITVNHQLLAMMGLQDFLKTVGKIRSRINPALQVEGILLTMCDARTNLCKVITEQVMGAVDMMSTSRRRAGSFWGRSWG